MTRETDGGGGPPTHTRQATIDALCEHFANDVMSIEEFERRVETAQSASTAEELQELLRDLPVGNVPAPLRGEAPAPTPSHGATAAADVKDKEFVVAVLGSSGRAGRWQPARKNYAVTVCGGAELDFRDAIMPPGVTELHVFTMCGGVDIIVPPGMTVESHGIALLGGFEHVADRYREPDPRAPKLVVKGVALMAGVGISVRHPGETARDARRRRKLEGREERRRLRDG